MQVVDTYVHLSPSRDGLSAARMPDAEHMATYHWFNDNPYIGMLTIY